MGEMTDDTLLALLEKHRGEAAKILERRASDPRDDHTAESFRWGEMAREVAAAMNGHPEFSVKPGRYFLSRQIDLSPWWQSRNLLERAARVGGEAALSWYRRVLNATSAHVDVVSVVYGLIVREAVEFSNGVRLVPVSGLKDTPLARHLASKARELPILTGPPFPAAAVLTFSDVVGEADVSAGHTRFLEAVETIRRTVTAFTLSETNTPTTGASWIDFHDNDLTASVVGYMWHGATYDGRLPQHPEEVDPSAIEWTEKVLALTGVVSETCNVALARLNLARRRQTPGDKAIDGCIVLEALLSDRQQGDLTYKLRLRAARLLGNDYIERRKISAEIGDFYRLRGNVVHGQSTGTSAKDGETAKKGLDLALEAVRKVVHEARLPDRTALELGPIDEAEEL